MKENDYKLLNGAVLAFIGDAYYEERIRRYCLDKGITNLGKLHDECVKYVSRTSQYKIIQSLILDEEEMEIFKRGRNHNYKDSSVEYINASGFEAVIGYLYLLERFERLDEIINKAIDIINNK
ncbi:MAG: Mini-ribonuclease 3 [Bacilli bacterium]|nr:Mini-ribonuclease 3 [Bacilli bacterium]